MDDESFKAIFSSYKNRDNNFQKFTEALGSAVIDLDTGIAADLGRAKSCLSLGTGNGKVEIEFIRRLMPNLQSFVAVEPDQPSATELRLNLQRHLSEVVAIIHETSAEQCHDVIEGQFDVVLLFSILALVDPGHRDILCQTLIPRWTAPGGVVVYVQFSRPEHPRSFYRILGRLNPEYTVPTYEHFQNLITGDESKSGQQRYRLESKFDVQYSQDLRNPDEAVLQMLRRLVRKDDIDVNAARNVIYEIWPDGKTDERFIRFGFFRKVAN